MDGSSALAFHGTLRAWQGRRVKPRRRSAKAMAQRRSGYGRSAACSIVPTTAGRRPALLTAALRATTMAGAMAPRCPLYNRPVRLPYPASHERLWRDDRAYDVIVVLGHNDDPVVDGAGSAIFWHLAQPDWRATEGCVAVERRTDGGRACIAAKPGATLTISL
jgi:hypothetical protein